MQFRVRCACGAPYGAWVGVPYEARCGTPYGARCGQAVRSN